jgi:hypothetical protein
MKIDTHEAGGVAFHSKFHLGSSTIKVGYLVSAACNSTSVTFVLLLCRYNMCNELWFRNQLQYHKIEIASFTFI